MALHSNLNYSNKVLRLHRNLFLQKGVFFLLFSVTTSLQYIFRNNFHFGLESLNIFSHLQMHPNFILYRATPHTFHCHIYSQWSKPTLSSPISNINVLYMHHYIHFIKINFCSSLLKHHRLSHTLLAILPWSHWQNQS